MLSGFPAYCPPPTALCPLALTFMSWPFLWAGLGLVSIPVVIHLLNRRRFRVVQWAAMEYLLKAMRKNRKRLKFEQWILLATRCLLIALIGVALARPLGGCSANTLAGSLGGRAGLNVFVIDNSYSAAYESPHAATPGAPNGATPAKTHLEQEKLIAKRLIDGLSGGGESVAIITAARPATAIIAKPGYDLNAAKAAVDRIEQSFGGTDLAGALQLALQLAEENPKAPSKHLHLLTDGTKSGWEGAQAEALKRAGPELAKHYRVAHYNMTEGRQQWNQAVLNLAPAGGLVTTQFETELATLARGFGPGPEATVRWTLDGAPLLARKDDPRSDRLGGAKLDPSAEPLTRVLAPRSIKGGGPRLFVAALGQDDAAGAGDGLRVDDRRYRVIDVTSELRVLIVQGTVAQNTLESSGTFLQIALAGASREAAAAAAAAGPGGTQRGHNYVAADLISDIELRDKPLGGYRAVILTGVGNVTERDADALRQFVEAGGTLMTFMGDPVTKDNYNAVLLPRKLLPGALIKLMDAGQSGAGYNFDFKPDAVLHPYLKLFALGEKTGLDTAQVRKYWQVDVPPDGGVERILNFLPPAPAAGATAAAATPAPAARTGTPLDPAYTVHALGNGRVIFSATTAAVDQWTSFPAKPAFPTLMHELLGGGVRTGDYWMNLQVGQPLEVPPEVKIAGRPELKDEAGTLVPIDPVSEPDRPTVYRSRPLTKPGVYTLNLGNATVPVAVNVPADEADVRTVGNEQVRRSLGDIDVALHGDAVPTDAALSRDANDWAGSVLVAMLALLAVESLMAMRFGHYRRAEAVRA